MFHVASLKEQGSLSPVRGLRGDHELGGDLVVGEQGKDEQEEVEEGEGYEEHERAELEDEVLEFEDLLGVEHARGLRARDPRGEADGLGPEVQEGGAVQDLRGRTTARDLHESAKSWVILNLSQESGWS